MNGLFGNYFAPVPQQNVSNYLRMPVTQTTQTRQMPSLADFVRAAYPEPEPDQSLGILQKISGYGTPVPQQQNKMSISTPNQDMTGLVIQRLASGYNGNIA